MSRVSVLSRVGLVAVWSAAAVTAATAGSVRGVVRDYAKLPPADRLGGAQVWVRPAKGEKIGPAKSDGFGKYQLPDVTDGEYVLVVTRFGYTTDDTLRVRVAGDTSLPDVRLMRPIQSKSAAAVVAANILDDAGRVPERRSAALNAEWARLGRLDLPPSSRIGLADELLGKADWVRGAAPEVARYGNADRTAVARVEQMFLGAFEKGDPIPTPASLADLKVGNVLVAEIALYSKGASRARPEVKETAEKEFRLRWGGTEALRVFDDPGRFEPFKGKMGPNPFAIPP